MRKRNPYIEKILYWLAPLLLFLGVFSSLVAFCNQMELNIQTLSIWPILLVACYVLMIVYRYLARVPGGKWIGFFAVLTLEIIVFVRFLKPVVKGVQYVINSFLKQFSMYAHIRVELLDYIDGTKGYASSYCITLLIGMLGVLIIAIVSLTFYSKRNVYIFLICTLPFVILPLFVGRMIFYIWMILYMISLVAIFGTGQVRGEIADVYLRNKAALILVVTALIAVSISYVAVTPFRYETKVGKISSLKKSLEDLSNYSPNQWMDWMRSNFGSDVLNYGKIGEESEVHHSGQELLTVQSDEGLSDDFYLKGYVGDVFLDNQWTTFKKTNPDYLKERDQLTTDPDKWQEVLVNYIKTGQGKSIQFENEQGNQVLDLLSQSQTLFIENNGLGRGNRVLPYYVKGGFQYKNNGKINYSSATKYKVESYQMLGNQLIYNKSLVNSMQSYIDKMYQSVMTGEELLAVRNFVRKYYLGGTEKYSNTFDDFFAKYSEGTRFYVTDAPKNENRIDLPVGVSSELVSIDQAVQMVKEYFANNMKYTLSPGVTPQEKDAIDYFVKESKEGYCVHFASAATMLFRMIGIPARYCEGVYVEAGTATTKKISVTDNNAHAWVEIYRDDIGWIPVDVTPGFGDGTGESLVAPSPAPEEATPTPVPQETEGPVAVATEEPQDTQEDNPIEETPAKEEQSQEEGQSDEEDMDYDDIEDSSSDSTNNHPKSPDKSTSQSGIPGMAKWIIFAIACLAAVVIQRRMRIRMFQQRVKLLPYSRKVIERYQHISPYLRRHNLLYQKQTVREYTKEIADFCECSTESMEPMVTYLLKAEFAGEALTRDEYREYVNALRKLEKVLKKKTHWYIKILYAYLIGM